MTKPYYHEDKDVLDEEVSQFICDVFCVLILAYVIIALIFIGT